MRVSDQVGAVEKRPHEVDRFDGIAGGKPHSGTRGGDSKIQVEVEGIGVIRKRPQDRRCTHAENVKGRGLRRSRSRRKLVALLTEAEEAGRTREEGAVAVGDTGGSDPTNGRSGPSGGISGQIALLCWRRRIRR